MASKIYSVHSLLYSNIESDYDRFSKIDLIKADMLIKILLEASIDFSFSRSSTQKSIYVDIITEGLTEESIADINRLGFKLRDGRIKIL